MYKRIMTPVDLTHADRLDRALRVAADLSKHYGAPVCYVGVTAETPGPVARTPGEYADKLQAFGEGQAKAHGHQVETKAYASHDPTTDVDDTLLTAVEETGADLVVMATHIPDVVDHFWPSNGGKIATHSDVSVLLVR